jgi:hypothetical protein
LAAFKTDAVMNRNIEYKIDEGANGVFADLTISYKHNGKGFDWKTTRYRTYTRIYVPAGSELLSSSGFTDPEVHAYSELGKTVFAGFLSIEPGQFGQLKLRYKLGDNVAQTIKAGQYELVFQKQPGSNVENLALNLKFNRNIKSFSPASFYAENYGDRVKWTSDMEADRVFRVEFSD